MRGYGRHFPIAPSGVRWVCIIFSVCLVLPAESPLGAIEVKCESGNCKNGRGTLVYESGASYTGGFKKGKFEGQGAFSYADGGVYEGAFSGGKRHGTGTLTLPDGTKYVGGWDNDEKHGSGTEYDRKGSVVRTGRWEKGSFAGK